MGVALDLICDKCGYYHRFLVGCGFRYDITMIFYNNMLELRQFIKSPEERVNIRNILLSNPEALILGSEDRIYRCPYCGDLQVNYYFKIHYGNEEYFPHYYCPRCETDMKPLDIDWKSMCNESLHFFNHKGQLITLSCPDCGSKEIRCYDGGFDWD